MKSIIEIVGKMTMFYLAVLTLFAPVIAGIILFPIISAFIWGRLSNIACEKKDENRNEELKCIFDKKRGLF